MKKLLFLVAGLAVILSACDPNEEIYKELDEEIEAFHETFALTLANDDYETIADLALEANPDDTLNAEFIENNGYFTEDVPAANYVPYLLENVYASYGPKSAASITFNYSGQMPEEYSTYVGANTYTLTEADYKAANTNVGFAKYFSPNNPADVYVPQLLSTNDASEGDILLVEYMQADADPEIDTSSTEDVVLYSEGFEVQDDFAGFSDFTLVGDLDWYWQSYGDGCLTMSGFDGSAANDAEAWLVSPEIDLSDYANASLSFSHAVNYINDQFDQLAVLVATNFDGDVATANWQEVEVPNMTTGASWSFEESGKIDLAAFTGETIHVAFQYTSTTDNASTWEVGSFEITTPGEAAVTGLDPYMVKDFYQFDGENWEKDNYAYYLTAPDYDAMGDPGNYNNFSESTPAKDYLPKFMDYKYPLAGNGTSKLIVYDFYNGSGTVTLASEYTYENGNWTSGFDYVTELTQQFVVGSENKWVFDPTVTFTMVGADFMLIVDERDSKYVDEYGTAEFYSGASSYYENFDLRITQREEYDPETFVGLSEEEAMAIIWDRILYDAIPLMLQKKYPDAVPQVSGVDVHYIITFETYNYSRATYTVDYQCTAAGDPPTFELVAEPEMIQ